MTECLNCRHEDSNLCASCGTYYDDSNMITFYEKKVNNVSK